MRVLGAGLSMRVLRQFLHAPYHVGDVAVHAVIGSSLVVYVGRHVRQHGFVVCLQRLKCISSRSGKTNTYPE